jgi:hypothetical protein
VPKVLFALAPAPIPGLAALSPVDRDALVARVMETPNRSEKTAHRVAVRDRFGRPLDPCRPARARRLVAAGRADFIQTHPPVIQLRGRR